MKCQRQARSIFSPLITSSLPPVRRESFFPLWNTNVCFNAVLCLSFCLHNPAISLPYLYSFSYLPPCPFSYLKGENYWRVYGLSNGVSSVEAMVCILLSISLLPCISAVLSSQMTRHWARYFTWRNEYWDFQNLLGWAVPWPSTSVIYSLMYVFMSFAGCSGLSFLNTNVIL